MTHSLFSCADLADLIDELISSPDDPSVPAPAGRQFLFARISRPPEKPAIAGDRLDQHTEVSAQTISTLQDDGELQGDSQFIETRSGGGRSRPDQAVSSGDCVAGPGPSQSANPRKGGVGR